MDKSEKIDQLAAALVEAQKEMPSIFKGADNPFFKSKYAPLDKVLPEVLKTLSKHGLALSQLPSNIDGQSALTTLLVHSSGQFISGTQPLLLAKNDPQGQGSAITYARRYASMAAIGMVSDDDDDGNKAPQAITKQEDELSKAKQKVYKAFEKAGTTDTDTMKAVLMNVLKRETIDSVADAELVIEHLEAGSEG